jgi:ribose-phosphate pyrophosphokinase
MELLIAIDACKRASAKSITAVIPYFGYARQDRKARARQPITARLVADMLQVAGAHRVVTVDLHAPQIQGFFAIPNDDLTAVSFLATYFLEKQLTKNLIIVSPDHGGTARARRMADIMHCPIAIVDKQRVKDNEAEALSIVGDVDGRVAIIVDDICDTGGSLLASVDMLITKGATEVYAAVTHGVLSHPAIENIEKSQIIEVVVTNTIALKETCPKITQIAIGPMIARTIEAIFDGTPVSDVYSKFATPIRG